MKEFSDVEFDNASPSQKIDIYVPDGTVDKKFPLVFFIHGGGFSKGDKKQGTGQDLANFQNPNYVLACTNYRLSGEAPFPAGLKDCEKALMFLLSHSKQYNIDPQRVAIMGCSAGGNFALMLALNKKIMSKINNKCVVALYPVIDMLSLKDDIFNLADDDPIKDYMIDNSEKYFNKKYSQVCDDELKAASPLFFLTKNMPDALLQHGTADKIVPFSQSQNFYEKATKLGVKVQFEPFAGADHSDEVFKTKQNLSRIFEFIDSKLR